MILYKFRFLLSKMSLASKMSSLKTRSMSENIGSDEITSKYFVKKNISNKKTKLTSIEEKTPEDDCIDSNQSKGKRKVSKQIEIKYESKTPKDWEQVLGNIREMRSERNAVVDQKGAEMCFDRNAVTDKVKRFQILVSLMLSSQTKDEITHSTMETLKQYGLTIDHIIQTSDEDLLQMIKSVNYRNTKAKNIKKTALILKDQFDGDIPRTVDSMLSLPGVGPKMTHLAMKIAWNECSGIAVDTHVHRICNRLGWAQSKAPEQTRKQFENWLPKAHWDDINLLLVGFGQTICTPLRPKCHDCLNEKLCPYALKP